MLLLYLLAVTEEGEVQPDNELDPVPGVRAHVLRAHVYPERVRHRQRDQAA